MLQGVTREYIRKYLFFRRLRPPETAIRAGLLRGRSPIAVSNVDMDAASAGFRVGYEDPSHFSREYKKQFGAPPQRDIAKIRGNLEI